MSESSPEISVPPDSGDGVPRVRGSIVASRLAFVEERWGAGAKNMLVGRLSLVERKQLQSVVVDGNWFPYPLLEGLDRAIVEELAEGEVKVLHEAGCMSAERGFRALASRLEGLSWEAAIERMVRVARQFQDFGEVSIERLEKKDGLEGAAFTFKYPPEISGLYCATALGYYQRTFELLGFQDVKVEETACQASGAEANRYQIRWGRPPEDRSPLPEPPEPPQEEWSEGGTTRVEQIDTSGLNLEAVGTKTASRSKRSVDRREKRLIAPRTLFLMVLVLLAGSYAVVYWYGALTVPPAPQEAPMQEFACAGTIQIEAKYGKPIILLTSRQEVTDVTFRIKVGNQQYALAANTLEADMLFEIGVTDFAGASVDTVPHTLIVNGKVEGRARECECRLLPPRKAEK